MNDSNVIGAILGMERTNLSLTISKVCDGLCSALARAILHENDHLDGHMYVEKVEGELVDNEELMAENEDA